MRQCAVLAVCAVAIGCSSQAEQHAPAPRHTKPQRIASLSLGTDEILCALVSPQRIVGLSRHSDNPEVSHVADVARQVGVKLDRDPERIVAHDPDLVLAARYSKIELRELVNQTGATVVVSTAFVSFDDIQGNIANIGRAVGEPERATALLTEMDLQLAAAADRPESPRTGWRLLYYAPSGWTAGNQTTVDEVIRAAGYRNAAVSISGHQKITAEKVLEIDPDALLIGVGYARDAGFRDQLTSDPQLATLAALHEGRVAELPAKRLLSVSQHLAEAVPALVDAVEALPSLRTQGHP
ncbi:MAG: ABC transporter substrate-binding protein [Bryobacterales bacterium]|nr:ABC transporter substrate-binding protein [Bryobacterales bacterium]